MKLLLAAAFALLAAPVLAADACTVTCKDKMAMDAVGITAAWTNLKTAMKKDAKVSAMADTDVAEMARDAYKASPDGTVMDAMKTSMTTSMTCNDLMAMDQTGMATAATGIPSTMKNNAKVSAIAEGDVTKNVGEACAAHPEGTVIDALKI